MPSKLTRRRSSAFPAPPALAAFVIGGLMILVGAYETWVGSAYITVEQGWSAFISGSVLLTGGLVTVSIGLAIRVLCDLRTMFAEGVERPVHDAAPAEPAFEEPTADFAPVADGMLLGTLEPEPVPDPPPRRGPRIPVMPLVTSDDIGPTAQADLGTTHLPIEPQFGDATEHAAKLDDHPAKRDDAEPVEAVHTAPVETSHDPLPAMDDWLDRSFADLDREVAGHAVRTHADEPPVASAMTKGNDLSAEMPAADLHGDHHAGTTHPAAVVEAKAEPTAEHGASETEPATALPARESATVDHELHEPSEPAVIGRYEAEGTSYVMFADGSIEAQSEAGVYRFASMAELKSYIEG